LANVKYQVRRWQLCYLRLPLHIWIYQGNKFLCGMRPSLLSQVAHSYLACSSLLRVSSCHYACDLQSSIPLLLVTHAHLSIPSRRWLLDIVTRKTNYYRNCMSSLEIYTGCMNTLFHLHRLPRWVHSVHRYVASSKQLIPTLSICYEFYSHRSDCLVEILILSSHFCQIYILEC
jgi:hypothetical protein